MASKSDVLVLPHIWNIDIANVTQSLKAKMGLEIGPEA